MINQQSPIANHQSKNANPDDSELRRRAEKKLKETSGSEDLAPERMADLVHDLQVHQIELKMQNDELCRIQGELEKMRDKYSHLYDFAPVGYFTLSEKGIIEEVNLALSSMLGIERSALIEKPFTRFVLREDQDIFYKHRQRLLEADPPRFCELRLIQKDGRAFHARLECLLLKNRGKGFSQIRAAVSDITENKRMEDQLRQSQKMESIGTLAGGIAHDFNNILAIIIGNTEMAIDVVPEWNPAREYLNEIQSAGTRAKDLVRHILSFSRKGITNRKPIRIGPIIEDFLKMLRASIPADIEIRQNLSCESDKILADPTQIGQVLMNLCTNAAHAMHVNGGILEVSLQNIEFKKQNVELDLGLGRHVKLTVSDTGHGIHPENINRIFDPYFTTKGLGAGTGLGLSVVQGIVKTHSGAIAVKSNPGEGTVFEVLIPLTEAEAQVEDKKTGAFTTGTEKILLIDDEASILKLVKKALERQGYQVEAQNNPVDALDLFRSEPDRFDLIITDMSMPKMTGDKFAKAVLSIRPGMPIILCSGYSDRIDTEKAAALGIRKYIEKPLNMSDFMTSIRKVLDGTKSSTQQ